MGTITIEGTLTLTRLCDAAEAMNCTIRYDATLGCVLTVRSQEPMYHNLTDAELLTAASRIDSLYIVKALAERLESAQECRRELEAAEDRIAELGDGPQVIADLEARVRDLESQLADCNATVSELESN